MISRRYILIYCVFVTIVAAFAFLRPTAGSVMVDAASFTVAAVSGAIWLLYLHRRRAAHMQANRLRDLRAFIGVDTAEEQDVDVAELFERAIARPSPMGGGRALGVDRETISEELAKPGRGRYVLTYRSRNRAWAKRYRISIHRRLIAEDAARWRVTVNGSKWDIDGWVLVTSPNGDNLTIGEWALVNHMFERMKAVRPEVVGSDRWMLFWQAIDLLLMKRPGEHLLKSHGFSWHIGAGYRLVRAYGGAPPTAPVDVCLSSAEDQLTVDGDIVVEDWWLKSADELATLLWKAVEAQKLISVSLEGSVR